MLFSGRVLVTLAVVCAGVAAQRGGRVEWDNHPETPTARIARGNLNPYNSIRPEYHDSPPSHGELEKIWQHHLSDHVYKSPFVRPMKSGLWEAGVPNRYAPGGYNRRKFKTEEEALLFVRHKTGAGMDVDYEAAKPSEKSFLEIESHKGSDDDDDSKQQQQQQQQQEDKKEDKKQESKSQQQESKEPSAEKLGDEEEAAEKDAESQLDRSADEQQLRDHNLKIAHKIREFLANYHPNKPIHVVEGYGSR